MNRSILMGCCVAGFASLGLSAAAAQNSAPAGAQASAGGEIEQDTMDALDKMGVSLRKLQSFAVRADATNEQVLTTGQKVQFGGRVDIKVRRPNGMRIDVVSDRQARSLYYDGKTLTVYSPRLGYFGSVAAPPTIKETLAVAARDYDIEIPLVDLFTWGEDPKLKARVKSAFYVGSETIGGIKCDQFAVRQENVDWQVWLRQAGETLPCKLVITSTDDPSMPQYSAVLTWLPQQTHAASAFSFVPPANSRKITLGKAPAQTADATN